MAVNVSFNGNTYAIPVASGESGWSSLSNYLIALSTGAATTGAFKQAVRQATSTPVTVATTDATVVCKLTVPGAVSVTLPTGVTKQIFVITDGTGDAATNAITVSTTGGQTINGSATYVLNVNRGGVMLQFDGTEWRILSAFYGSNPSFASITVTSLKVSGLSSGVMHSDASGNVSSSLVVDADVDASAAISAAKLANTPSGNLGATTVQAALNELQSDVDTRATSSALTTHTGASTGVHGVTGAVVGTTDSQFLTNKNLTNANNTLSGATANSFTNVGTVSMPIGPETLVGRATTDTLTNKTIVTPVIDDYFDINEESVPGTPSAGRVRVYAKSDAKLYKKDDAGVEQEIGAGGSGGGVNYIANPLFADGTVTGWATYADAAGTTPVNGTGGSPNVSFTSQSGSLVRGTFSGRLTKDAANRQGQGASYDFTIDASDVGNPLLVSFDFLAGASYVAGDLSVYLYDVTNSVLITPSSVNVAAGKGSFKAFFVSTTSTSYRLILHVASTNSSAWTVDTDNFEVGPQSYLAGFARRPSAARYTRGTAQSIANGTLTVVDYATQVFDTGSEVTTGAGWKFTAKQNGYYQVGASVLFDSSTAWAPATKPAGMQLWKNGVQVTVGNRIDFLPTGPAIFANVKMEDTIFLSAGDYIDIRVSQDTGASLNLNPNAIYNYVNVSLIEAVDSNVTMAARAVESYSSDDGSADVFGPNGSLVPNVAFGAGGTSRDFTFQNARNATDLFVMEVNNQGLGWIPAFSAYPYSVGNNGVGTNEYGMRGYWFSATTFRVRFGNQGTIPILSTASNGEASWATEFTAGTRFRVRQVSGGAAVGFPVGVRNVVGDTTGTAVPTGYIGQELIATRTATVTGATTNATYTDITGLSITLTPGVWDVEAFATVAIEGVTGTAGQGFSTQLVLTDSANGIITGALGGIANASQPESVDSLRVVVRRLITADTIIKARFAPITYGGTPTATACQVIAAAGYPATIRAVRVG